MHTRFLISQVSMLAIIVATVSSTACGRPQNEASLISNARQLTFEGLRAGEGYFGSDSGQLVFQSERDPSNPFFQIFLLDLEFGDVTPVSPGHGKTTCAWIHPDGNQVLFASTHDDPEARTKQKNELEFRESGQTRRYSWDYDEHYEIYAFNKAEKNYKRITNAKGYDAEGSYSPDGKLIAFASNRNAYSKTLSDDARKKFELDPAYMMDIFIMNSDGSNLKQLTNVPGYDGGPFFSPDGKRICWRRFAENGATAEIMTMNIDGTDQKQITKMGALSWAPFYHPSGEYLVYTTNKHGFSNFELYLVDTAGKSTPVRVTDTAGFDGLASFSPDGTKITWTSNRNEKKQSQIYLADWNHKKALELLKIDTVGSSAAERNARVLGKQSAGQTAFDFEARDVVRHVDYLCRKELGGRMTGTKGEKQATAYVAAYLENLGLVPDGDDGSWFQQFEFPAGVELSKENTLSANQQKFIVKNDWQPLTFSNNGEFNGKNVVFAGYGISAPESGSQPAYDSYKGINVEGKWVLMFRYLPENVDDQRRTFLAEHSGLRKKIMVARDKGATGIVVVSGPNSNVTQQLVQLQKDFSNSGSSIAAISITDRVAQQWLDASQKNLGYLQTQHDSGNFVAGFELKNLELSARIDVKPIVGIGRNILGRLMAGAVPSKDAIIVGAHIDHLGKGGSGSLAKQDERGAIHFGADDNASGVAAMLEIAEYLAGLKRQGKLNMKRDIIFAGWSGEELGLYGSKHYAKSIAPESKNAAFTADPYNGDPHDLNQLQRYHEQYIADFNPSNFSDAQFKLLKSNASDIQIVVKLLSSSAANSNGRNDQTIESYSRLLDQSRKLISKAELVAPKNSQNRITKKPISACLNMDMVGRFDEKLVLQGLGSSKAWNRMIEKANVVVGLPIETSDDTQLPTDASSFYQAGVPILSAFTGSHTDYHTPRDTPDKLRYPEAARIANLMGLVARQLVISDQTPTYIKRSEKKQKRIARTGRRARLGTVPNYTEKVNGVLLDDVEPGGPAATAGLKGGDIIVELGDKKIDNIYDFQYAIDGLKVGSEIDIVILREKKRMELKITPGSRD